MKWLCSLKTSLDNYLLFIQCHAPKNGASVPASLSKKGGASAADAEASHAGARDLLASAASFLATGTAGGAEEASASSRASARRPTTSDMRRRAAALSKAGAITDSPKSIRAGTSGEDGTRTAPVAYRDTSATSPDDELRFLLVGCPPGQRHARVEVWAPRRALTVSEAAPAGMSAAVYGGLLDLLLRPNPSEGSSQVEAQQRVVRVVVPAEQAADTTHMCRVELRVSLSTRAGCSSGRGDLVLAAVELYPEPLLPPSGPSGTPRLMSLLQLLAAHVTTGNNLQRVAERQESEIAELRRALAQRTSDHKASCAEETLLPLRDILNAKKDKIRELTAALQLASQKASQPEPHTAAPSAAVKKEPTDEEGDMSEGNTNHGTIATTRPLAERGSHRGRGTLASRRGAVPVEDAAARTPEFSDTDEEGDDVAPVTHHLSAQGKDATPLPVSCNPPPAKQSRQEGQRPGEEFSRTGAWLDDLFQV